ncbi:MAG: thioesterase family protein [Lachnospiraceae bacterium]|nr:thioesterase family protein [Lachnospiraceae bacterium]
MLNIGIKGIQELIVTKENCAGRIGSGELDVFATPAMLALVEKTAWMSVADELEKGEGTVGTKVSLSHSAPTPLGKKVRCETELVEIDRKRLVFNFTVYDDSGVVGSGTHERFIINSEKFIKKALEKG